MCGPHTPLRTPSQIPIEGPPNSNTPQENPATPLPLKFSENIRGQVLKCSLKLGTQMRVVGVGQSNLKHR